MDAIPWPLVTGATGGWVVTVAFLWALLTGRLVTQREAQLYLDRAEKAEARLERQGQQNSDLLTFAELGRSTFNALRERALEEAP